MWISREETFADVFLFLADPNVKPKEGETWVDMNYDLRRKIIGHSNVMVVWMDDFDDYKPKQLVRIRNCIYLMPLTNIYILSKLLVFQVWSDRTLRHQCKKKSWLLKKFESRQLLKAAPHQLTAKAYRLLLKIDYVALWWRKLKVRGRNLLRRRSQCLTIRHVENEYGVIKQSDRLLTLFCLVNGSKTQARIYWPHNTHKDCGKYRQQNSHTIHDAQYSKSNRCSYYYSAFAIWSLSITNFAWWPRMFYFIKFILRCS